MARLKAVLQITRGAEESSKKNGQITGKNNKGRSEVKPHKPKTNSSQ